MAQSIKTFLAGRGVLAHVILPAEIDLLLSSLEPTAAPADQGGGILTGAVKLTEDLSKSPIPGFDLALTAPTGVIQPAPFKLKLTPAAAPTGFQFWLVLAQQGQARLVFKLVDKVPGLGLTGAKRIENADGTVTLEALAPGDPKHAPVLVSRSTEAGAALGPALLVAGTASEPAQIRFTPDTDSTKGIVALGLEPATVVFGSSGLGFECPALVLDDSETATGPGRGAPALDPPLDSIAADTPAWRGILARQLDFYLPAGVPLFGGRPVKGYFAVPRGAGGAQLVVESSVPAQPAVAGRAARPGYTIRIECLDPTAQGMSGLVPTLISATMELPLDNTTLPFKETGGTGRDVKFAAGKPVRVTATLARDPVNSPGTFRIGVGVSARGEDGLLSVTSTSMGGAKIFNTAAALATALIADQDIDRKAKVGDAEGVVLYALVAAGAVLSSLFEPDSRFVLHGVEIESTGHGFPVGGPVVLTLDYSVAIRVTKIDLEALSVQMSPDQPMRIRVRKARMSLDPAKSGLEMIGLDFDRAEMEIENPGAWDVQGLESLFDVLGSRSGRGSSWIEVDLRFKLNLGPIRVTGATIRATLTKSGKIEASIRGLEAGLTIPGAIEASGSLQLDKADGFAADLLAKIIPINLNADAGVIYKPPMIVLRLDVDLPAPIPLANSGFGLYGIGGLLGLSAEPDYGNGVTDPVLRQLQWQPKGVNSFKRAPDQSTFGFNAAVGTLPDYGFSFSAKAGILITVPDVAVRASLNGRVLQPVVKLTDPSYPPPPGLSFLGFLSVNSEALMFGVLGNVDLRPLLEIRVPLAGRFPFGPAADDWYVYLGADGAPVQGRGIGPITARVLPDILDVGADAYVMLRGKGIQGWPHGRDLPSGPLTIADGFVLAFGFSLQSTFGPVPIAWAELYASLDLSIGARPPTLAGFGRAGGSLHLGPFSLGVQAQVTFLAREEAKYFWAEVTGRIELLFFDVEGKVTIAFGEKPKLDLPDPDRHPLDRLTPDGLPDGSTGVLTDDSYRVLARLVDDPDDITDDMRVWPDAIVSLPFAIPPAIKTPEAASQFPGVTGPGAVPPAAKLGSEMLYYKWRLDRLELRDVTEEADPRTGTGKKPPGQLTARWQVPRGLSAAGDVSELLLGSASEALWVNRLADAGEGRPESPLKQAADRCHDRVAATPGWAIGFLAAQERPGFRLPPDPLSPNPMVSRVEARLHHYAVTRRMQPVPLDEVFTLPSPFSLDPASLVRWPAPQEIRRPFEGHLVAPTLRWLTGRPIEELLESDAPFVEQRIDLVLTEPITDGVLLIVADPALLETREHRRGIVVTDDTGAMWAQVDLVRLPTGETGGLYPAPTPAVVGTVSVFYPVGTALGVVGLGGITTGAAAAAAAENQAIQDEIARQAAAAQNGPKTDPAANAASQRVILGPGRLYRIDVDMSWSGEIFQQDENGKPISAGSKSDETEYRPKGSAARQTANRRLFFRTAPPPGAARKPRYGAAQYLKWSRRRQDVFEPEMLDRYLAGYEPGQSEEFRFCDDPLRAHFRQDHVAALAKAYDFTMSVAVRRVDRPGDEYEKPTVQAPTWSFATAPALLGPADQSRYRYAVESECEVPTPGATASVLVPLEPEGWYEVYVLAKSDKPLKYEDGRLPGVTFRTSRWRTPEGMFAGLGFTVADQTTATVMTGDLAIPAGALAGAVEGSDQAFQEALLALGLDGWPAPDAPRLSRLWLAGDTGDWRFAGLMVESPEPVHRPGRVELEGLSLSMGRSGGSVGFDIRRRDRSGSRLIYLTPTPFQVVTRELIPFAGWPFAQQLAGMGWSQYRRITPQLVLKAAAILHEARTDVSASLVIPQLPAFAEDP